MDKLTELSMEKLSDLDIERLCEEQAYLFSYSTNYDFSSENFYRTILKNIESRSLDHGHYVDLFHLYNSVKIKRRKTLNIQKK